MERVESRAEFRTVLRRRIFWFLVWSVLLAAPFLVRDYVLQDRSVPSVCLFRNLTGVGCPGCGLTRSVCRLSELRFKQSIRFHAFGPVFYAGALFGWLYLAATFVLRRPPFPLDTGRVLRLVLFLQVAMIVYWGVRLFLGIVP